MTGRGPRCIEGGGDGIMRPHYGTSGRPKLYLNVVLQVPNGFIIIIIIITSVTNDGK
jgi:hypothetical protein